MPRSDFFRHLPVVECSACRNQPKIANLATTNAPFDLPAIIKINLAAAMIIIVIIFSNNNPNSYIFVPFRV